MSGVVRVVPAVQQVHRQNQKLQQEMQQAQKLPQVMPNSQSQQVSRSC